MATVIRPEISEKNRYWIDKHRHYELKHFCLQLPFWRKAYRDCLDCDISMAMIDKDAPTEGRYDPTGNRATLRAYYSKRINLVEQAAKEADKYLWHYILLAVTEGLSYTYLKTKMEMPCGKDMYYDRYRKFFWILSQLRD